MVLLEFLRMNLIQFHLSYLSPQNYVLHMHLYSKTFFPSSSFFLPRIYIYSGYNYFSRDLVFRTLFLWLLASRYTWICQGHSKNGILGTGVHKQNPLDLLWVPTPVSLSVPLKDLSILSTFPPELWAFSKFTLIYTYLWSLSKNGKGKVNHVCRRPCGSSVWTYVYLVRFYRKCRFNWRGQYHVPRTTASCDPTHNCFQSIRWPLKRRLWLIYHLSIWINCTENSLALRMLHFIPDTA